MYFLERMVSEEINLHAIAEISNEDVELSLMHSPLSHLVDAVLRTVSQIKTRARFYLRHPEFSKFLRNTRFWSSANPQDKQIKIAEWTSYLTELLSPDSHYLDKDPTRDSASKLFEEERRRFVSSLGRFILANCIYQLADVMEMKQSELEDLAVRMNRIEDMLEERIKGFQGVSADLLISIDKVLTAREINSQLGLKDKSSIMNSYKAVNQACLVQLEDWNCSEDLFAFQALQHSLSTYFNSPKKVSEKHQLKAPSEPEQTAEDLHSLKLRRNVTSHDSSSQNNISKKALGPYADAAKILKGGSLDFDDESRPVVSDIDDNENKFLGVDFDILNKEHRKSSHHRRADSLNDATSLNNTETDLSPPRPFIIEKDHKVIASSIEAMISPTAKRGPLLPGLQLHSQVSKKKRKSAEKKAKKRENRFKLAASE